MGDCGGLKAWDDDERGIAPDMMSLCWARKRVLRRKRTAWSA